MGALFTLLVIILLGVVARELGPAVLGLQVHTLWTAAAEVLARAGQAPAEGGVLLDVLVEAGLRES